MTTNRKRCIGEPVIEFVSYDGAYPNLCSGTFIVKINGKETSFGRQFLWECEKKNGVAPADYPKFWTSGGRVSFDDEWSEIVNEKVQTVGNKLYDLAVEWMDELRPEGKSK